MDDLAAENAALKAKVKELEQELEVAGIEVYCRKCGACGEDGCCPATRCLYSESYKAEYLKDKELFEKIAEESSRLRHLMDESLDALPEDPKRTIHGTRVTNPRTLELMFAMRELNKKDDLIGKLRMALKYYSSAQVRERHGWMDSSPLYQWTLRKGEGWHHYTVPHGAKPWDIADKALDLKNGAE